MSPVPSANFLAALRIFLTAALCLVAASAAQAQVAALVNGAPITETDIAQRSKLIQISTGKNPSHKEVLDELINEQLKISIARRYSGLEVTNKDIDNVFANMAQRSRLSPAQMEQSLASRGISIGTLKTKIRADLIWGQLVRGKFQAELQIGETDVRDAMQTRKEDAPSVGYIYKIYPIVLVGPHTTDAERTARVREAESLRSRFQSCAEGLRMVRTLRDVVVREPMLRSSSDLAPALRDILDKIELGHLTNPEVTQQGLQMFAVCERNESKAESPAKRAVREELFNKRFDQQSKKFLEEIRRQSLIEYR